MPMLKQVPAVALGLMLLCGCSTEKSGKESATGGSQGSRAYQATYSSPDNFAYHTEHFYSDGAGHLRIDISGEGITPTVVNVLDLNKNETIAWAAGVNKYVRRPSQPTDPLVMRVQMEKLPKDGEQLGARIISGHRCHGWRGMAGTEVWFDDEYGCPILATSGGITTSITAFSAQAPDPSIFEPPVGYRQVSTGDSGLQTGHQDKARFLRDAERYIH